MGEGYNLFGAENPILGEEHNLFGAKNPILGEECRAFGAKSVISEHKKAPKSIKMIANGRGSPRARTRSGRGQGRQEPF